MNEFQKFIVSKNSREPKKDYMMEIYNNGKIRVFNKKINGKNKHRLLVGLFDKWIDKKKRSCWVLVASSYGNF